MLSFPKYGWTTVHLEDETGESFTAQASYLTPVHLDTINAFTNFFKTNKPQSVYYDAEGFDYIVVINWCDIYVIENKEESKLYYLVNDINVLADQLIADIENAFDEWVNFCSYDCEDEEQNRLELSKALAELKQAKNDFNEKYKCNVIYA